MPPWSPSGLKSPADLPWGSHLAHFFGAGEELRDLLVPYFKAGIDNNERCLWVTGAAFAAEQARAALRAIEIVDGEAWYSSAAKLQPHELVAGLLQREQEALQFGYAGLRASGNCAWVADDQWADFIDYEALLQEASGRRRMICLCSYATHGLGAGAHLEVMERHDMAVPAIRGAAPRW
jgi:hypothetical protein